MAKKGRDKRMRNEALTNMGFVCAKHSPRPNPKFKKIPLKKFYGKLVKLGFKVSVELRKEIKTFMQENGLKGEPPTKEHMWVRVLGPGEKKELRGQLDNTPVFALDWDLESLLEFSRAEIEKFFDGKKEI
jgi:hypothetical protein